MNINKLKKNELIVYLTGKCRHRNPYYIDKGCFKKEILEGNNEIKIGILDIETCGLTFNADGSIIICYYIKEYGKKKYYSGKIKISEIRNGILDKNIVTKLVKDLSNFNIIITFNGNYFDIPFIRTRALIHNLEFIKYGYIKSIDIYKTVKYKLKLHRNSLKNTCKIFGIDGKTELDFYTWIQAIGGNKEKFKEILNHCKHDVDITEKLYNKIIDYERKINRSI